jgi:hypothetical protein
MLDRFSQRAAENSKLAPRASNGEMKLHDTGKAVASPSMKTGPQTGPRTTAAIDRRYAGKDDPNHVGDAYFPGVRRNP